MSAPPPNFKLRVQTFCSENAGELLQNIFFPSRRDRQKITDYFKRIQELLNVLLENWETLELDRTIFPVLETLLIRLMGNVSARQNYSIILRNAEHFHNNIILSDFYCDLTAQTRTSTTFIVSRLYN